MRWVFNRVLLIIDSRRSISQPIFIFALPLFFLILADSTMSYIFPLVVEESLGSNTMLGVIMALSSVAGLTFDFLYPVIMKKRGWKFQIIAAILLSFLFPISVTLGATFSIVWLFILGSIVWGIYWELTMFSQQNFVVEEESKNSYSKDWGILYLLFQLTTIIGPILGSLLLSQSIVIANVTLTLIQILSLTLAIPLLFLISNKRSGQVISVSKSFSILNELRIWRVIAKTLWPAIFTGISISLVNASFWTIGAIFGESILGDSGLEWIVVFLHFSPAIIGSIVLAKLNIKSHKKRISQTALFIGGSLLALMAFINQSSILMLILIGVSSLAFSFVGPLNDAVYSDLLGRVKGEKSHLLGIAKANASIAFIVGPLLVGFLADRLGYSNTFSVIGAITMFVSLTLLLHTPRKIKLPQKELEEMAVE